MRTLRTVRIAMLELVAMPAMAPVERADADGEGRVAVVVAGVGVVVVVGVEDVVVLGGLVGAAMNEAAGSEVAMLKS